MACDSAACLLPGLLCLCLLLLPEQRGEHKGLGFFCGDLHPCLQADKFNTRLYCCTGLGGCWSLILHLKVFGDWSWCFTSSPRYICSCRFCSDRNGCCLSPMEEENSPPRRDALRVHLHDLVQQRQGFSPSQGNPSPE